MNVETNLDLNGEGRKKNAHDSRNHHSGMRYRRNLETKNDGRRNKRHRNKFDEQHTAEM
jgi:hypothetical protein